MSKRSQPPHECVDVKRSCREPVVEEVPTKELISSPGSNAVFEFLMEASMIRGLSQKVSLAKRLFCTACYFAHSEPDHDIKEECMTEVFPFLCRKDASGNICRRFPIIDKCALRLAWSIPNVRRWVLRRGC
jgi:hypothetical protein